MSDYSRISCTACPAGPVQLRYPWDLLAWTPFWIIAASAIAGLLPAARAARIQPAAALRSE